MKRKIVFACMISALLLLQTAMAAPNVEVNGTQIDTDAVIIDDKTYVPLRGVLRPPEQRFHGTRKRRQQALIYQIRLVMMN